MMRYILIAEKEPYTLILRGNHLQEYAVVSGLYKEKGEWDWTCCYYSFGEHTELAKEKALFMALDDFIMRTDKKYVQYGRVCEIARMLAAGLIEDDADEAYEYMCGTMELSEREAGMLDLDMDKYREISDSGDEANAAASCTSGDYGPSHPWDAPGMSIRDFI